MRGSGVIGVACLALSLGAAHGAGALAAEKEPVTGGFIATPGSPVPAPPQAPAAAADPQTAPPLAAAATEPAVTKADDTSWGLVARGGYFGLPDVIANQLFSQHPEVDGTIYGGEIRLHGDGGGRGVFSVGFAVDYGETSAYGIWQTDESSAPQAGSGDISMLAVTVTGYWNIVPTGVIHPYVGLGIGAGYFKGTIQEEADLVEVETVLPVLHIPIGLALELGEHLQLSLEARVINGVAAGGSLQIRF
jgi:opacity protein-like surface antigen